ncbi:MAG: FHA domain-containing protein [Planctomycetales bacterium]|nr:FHA domain-containing protein [Planctomycetales bacterium]
MKVVLEIVEGIAAGRKKSLRAPIVMTVGRGDAADWRVPEDSAMSSKHFEVAVRQDGCYVTDLDSTNGTIVEGVKITRLPLTDGIQIKAGATSFRVSMSPRESTTSLIAGLESEQGQARAEAPIDQQPATIAREVSVPPDSIPVSEVLRQTELIGQTQPSPSPPSGRTNSSTVEERGDEYRVGQAQSRPFAGAVIEVVSEYARGRKAILRSGQSITIGRTDRADFVVADPQLSASHFRITDDRSGWQLTDLNSTAGTSLNGTKISTSLLKSGDRVVAGQTQFVVTIGESAPLSGRKNDSLCPFQQGVRDEDPKVRRAAIEAAAWSGEPWLLDFCRENAKEPSPENRDALVMMSILGLPSDLQLVRDLARRPDLGPSRFELLASFAHPAVVPDLLQSIKGDDLVSAVAAASAFSRITGLDIASDQRTSLPPDEGEGEDDEEFAEDVLLPDAGKAERLWQQQANQFASGTAFRQGLETSGPPTDTLLQQLDQRSRWEVCIRGKFEGTWNGSPFELERFIIP